MQVVPKSRRRHYNAAMRRIILGLGISLDGYIARLNGDVDFLFMPKDYSMAAFFKRIDTAILGRKTYDVAKKMGGGFGPGVKYYVFSRRLKPGERGELTFVRGPIRSFVAQLRRQKGKDIWLMGGGELARDFLKADLVDEIYLGIVPVLIGKGIPLFLSGYPQRDFKLVDNKAYSRGLVSLTYERTRKKRAGR